MAYVSANSSYNWILSLKLVLMSTGVLSLAVMLKLSLPVVSDFIAYEIPSIWSFLLSWLRPPYLYIVINFIIISIVASSKMMQQKTDYPEPEMPVVQPLHEKVVSGDLQEDSIVCENGAIFGGTDYHIPKVSVSEVHVVDSEGAYGGVEKKAVNDAMLMNGHDEAVLTMSAWTGGLQRKDSLEVVLSNNENEKPPVSMRFAQRRPLKASPEAGKALRVSKPKREETLENTWKTITEGRTMPLTRHLKKSDARESHMRHSQPTDENTPPRMKKYETFSDRSANSSLSPSPGSGRLRKEPSLGQDELNRRVEAFIKKFNEEMRLQRQESLNQYHEMISRGAH